MSFAWPTTGGFSIRLYPWMAQIFALFLFSLPSPFLPSPHFLSGESSKFLSSLVSSGSHLLPVVSSILMISVTATITAVLPTTITIATILSPISTIIIYWALIGWGILHLAFKVGITIMPLSRYYPHFTVKEIKAERVEISSSHSARVTFTFNHHNRIVTIKSTLPCFSWL